MRPSSLMASAAMLTTMLLVAVPNAGCPSDEKECKEYRPPASFDPNAATSFRQNVVPIFNTSCTFTTCHGTQSGSSNGIYLGGTNSDPASVRAGIVDKPAPELATMAFVKPGDPENSYLMRKMDGTQCLLDARCKDGNCGDSMPKNEETLAESDRLVVRRWILQGAPDN